MTVTRIVRSWAYGYAVVAAKRTQTDGPGVAAAFLAHRTHRGWVVTFQGTTAYGRAVRRSPRGLIPTLVPKLDAPPASSELLGGSGPSAAPEFVLPWTAWQTWHLWLGPHNTDNDFGPHPYTSLDFAGGDGIVRAAAGGTVYRPCANLVVVDHGGGWETGYYHMPTILVHDGQTVTAGQPLGTTGTAVGCRGYAHGAHVHFSIYHFAMSGVRNVFQTPSGDMDGVVIGGWVVHDGSRSGLGYMQRLSDGAIVYPSDTCGTGSIYNDGTAGGAKPATPTGYVTLAAINVRSGPGVFYGIVGSLANGAPVSIVCQTRGDSVQGSTIWDQLSSGGYLSDYYVNTPVVGGFSPGLSQCGTTTTTTTTTTPTTTTITTTPTPTPPDREAVVSYNRMSGGAPYHGFFTTLGSRSPRRQTQSPISALPWARRRFQRGSLFATTSPSTCATASQTGMAPAPMSCGRAARRSSTTATATLTLGTSQSPPVRPTGRCGSSRLRSAARPG